MLRVLVLLGLAACYTTVEGRQYCCSAEDRHIVQEQWDLIWTDTESSQIRVTLGRHILLALAKEFAEVNDLFKGVDIAHPEGGAFSAHALRILNAIDQSINLLDHPEALDSALDHLADQHKVREGVKKAHFQKIGEILHNVLRQVLDDYNALSWKACFKGILQKISSKLQA